MQNQEGTTMKLRNIILSVGVALVALALAA